MKNLKLLLGSVALFGFSACFDTVSSTGVDVEEKPVLSTNEEDSGVKTGVFEFSDGTTKTMEYQEIDGDIVVEGDIIIDAQPKGLGALAKTSDRVAGNIAHFDVDYGSKWEAASDGKVHICFKNRGVVHYLGDRKEELNETQRKNFDEFVSMGEQRIDRYINTFVENNSLDVVFYHCDQVGGASVWNEKQNEIGVRFKKLSKNVGGNSYVGKRKDNVITLNTYLYTESYHDRHHLVSNHEMFNSPFVFNNYLHMGTFRHEVGHALGLLHEHQRQDRDFFVRVVETHNQDNLLLDYNNYSISKNSSAHGSYDENSIMNYSLMKVAGGKIHRGANYSEGDINAINSIYNPFVIYHTADGDVYGYLGEGMVEVEDVQCITFKPELLNDNVEVYFRVKKNGVWSSHTNYMIGCSPEVFGEVVQGLEIQLRKRGERDLATGNYLKFYAIKSSPGGRVEEGPFWGRKKLDYGSYETIVALGIEYVPFSNIKIKRRDGKERCLEKDMFSNKLTLADCSNELFLQEWIIEYVGVEKVTEFIPYISHATRNESVFKIANKHNQCIALYSYKNVVMTSCDEPSSRTLWYVDEKNNIRSYLEESVNSTPEEVQNKQDYEHSTFCMSYNQKATTIQTGAEFNSVKIENCFFHYGSWYMGGTQVNSPLPPESIYAVDNLTPLISTLKNAVDYDYWDWDGDRVLDIVVFKKGATGTNSTEIHVLNGADNYRSFLYQRGTVLPETGDNWVFKLGDMYNDGGRPDIYAIKKSATGTNSLEVHVMSGHYHYTRFFLQTGTIHSEVGDNYEFDIGDPDRNGRPDIYAIKKNHTGTNSTEIHILNGTNNFQSYLLQKGTVLQETNEDYSFSVRDYNSDGVLDIVALKNNNTGTQSTEIHILNGANSYRSFLLQTGTQLFETQDRFHVAFEDYDGDGRLSLMAIENDDFVNPYPRVIVMKD